MTPADAPTCTERRLGSRIDEMTTHPHPHSGNIQHAWEHVIRGIACHYSSSCGALCTWPNLYIPEYRIAYIFAGSAPFLQWGRHQDTFVSRKLCCRYMRTGATLHAIFFCFNEPPAKFPRSSLCSLANIFSTAQTCPQWRKNVSKGYSVLRYASCIYCRARCRCGVSYLS